MNASNRTASPQSLSGAPLPFTVPNLTLLVFVVLFLLLLYFGFQSLIQLSKDIFSSIGTLKATHVACKKYCNSHLI